MAILCVLLEVSEDDVLDADAGGVEDEDKDNSACPIWGEGEGEQEQNYPDTDEMQLMDPSMAEGGIEIRHSGMQSLISGPDVTETEELIIGDILTARGRVEVWTI